MSAATTHEMPQLFRSPSHQGFCHGRTFCDSDFPGPVAKYCLGVILSENPPIPETLLFVPAVRTQHPQHPSPVGATMLTVQRTMLTVGATMLTMVERRLHRAAHVEGVMQRWVTQLDKLIPSTTSCPGADSDPHQQLLASSSPVWAVAGRKLAVLVCCIL